MESIKILCIGDSLTAGFPEYDPMWGGDPNFQYCYWLEKELEKRVQLKINIKNEGVCGDTTGQIARRLAFEIKKKSPDIVLAFGGGNDIVIGYSPLRIKKNVLKIISLTKAHKVTLIAGTVTPFAKHLILFANNIFEINPILCELFTQTETPYADLERALSDNEGYLRPDYDSGDGVHLNIEGYKKIAFTFLPLVLERIEVK